MSRGGRGGRGGGRNTGGRMGGQPLPFNIDPELEAEVERTIADGHENNIHAELFPDIDLITPAPSTAEERKWVQMYRVRRAKMRSSPLWTGDAGAYASKKGHPEMPGGFDPFESAPTFSYGKRKRETVHPNLKNVKNIYPQFFPKELRHLFEDPKDGAPRPAKKLALARQTVKDRLAKFDEDADEVNLDDEDEREEGQKGDEEGEDAVEQPVDSEYEEDEDDDGDDYNAEQYFDGGEADYDEPGNDEYGDD